MLRTITHLRPGRQLCGILLLPLPTKVLVTTGVGLQPHRGEEVKQGVVAEVARHLPEPQQMLQRVLHQEPGHNAHGGGQAGRAHPVLLQGFLVNTARTGGQQGNGPKLGKHIRSTPTACKGQLCTVQR